jgi:hypothetical protein
MLEIVTAVVNNPKFIELQYKTLKKFVKGEFRFTVFNDSKLFADFTNYGNTNLYSDIREVCQKLDIKCIKIPNQNHMFNKDAAKRCADAYNFMLMYMLENPGKYLSIDSDMFLISEFNVNQLDNYNVAIVPQFRGHIEYFWNGIFYFDTIIMKNKQFLKWNNGFYEGENTDVGGAMYQWLRLEKQRNLNLENSTIYKIKHLPSLTWNSDSLPENVSKKVLNFCDTDCRNEKGQYFTEIYDTRWLHYRAGGNWRGEGLKVHMDLTRKLDNMINELVY